MIEATARRDDDLLFSKVSAQAIAALAILLVLFSFLIGLYAVLYAVSADTKPHDLLAGWMVYTMSVLSADYLGLGWVRRGLPGTIVLLFGRDPVVRGVAFHAFSLMMFLIPAVMLVRRFATRVSVLASVYSVLFLLFSPQTFLSWRNDLARTDLLSLAFIAWTFLLASRGRWRSAFAVLGASILVHETGVVFGFPLLLAYVNDRRLSETLDRRGFLEGLALFIVIAAVLIIGPSLFGPGSGAIVAYMLQHAPPAINAEQVDLRDCAIYMLAMGGRGLATAVCYNRIFPLYWAMAAMSMVVVVASAYSLGLLRRRFLLSGVTACLLSVVAMNIIANDSGRWVTFAVVELWLISAVAQIEGLELTEFEAASGSLVLLGLISLGSSNVHEVNHAAERIARRLGASPSLSVGDWMTRCDPEWKSVITRGRNGFLATAPPSIRVAGHPPIG